MELLSPLGHRERVATTSVRRWISVGPEKRGAFAPECGTLRGTQRADQPGCGYGFLSFRKPGLSCAAVPWTPAMYTRDTALDGRKDMSGWNRDFGLLEPFLDSHVQAVREALDCPSLAPLTTTNCRLLNGRLRSGRALCACSAGPGHTGLSRVRGTGWRSPAFVSW